MQPETGDDDGLSHEAASTGRNTITISIPLPVFGILGSGAPRVVLCGRGGCGGRVVVWGGETKCWYTRYLHLTNGGARRVLHM